MRTTILALGLILTAPFVFADDKKSGNNLKVKINHDLGVVSDRFGRKAKKTLQFVYDTREVLIITNRPETETGVAIKRSEVKKFQELLNKMIKFASAIHENKITGVKKVFEDKSLYTSLTDDPPMIDMSETGDPSDKTQIRVRLSFNTPAPGGGLYVGDSRLSWNYAELEVLGKIFDEKQKEVFKKYDILKALND
ncbi:MAG: hypothetical protein CMO74_13070 [Verrucomicrobiales bacterium]|nr:hypothetical protein [Verrucomicrobiales bacterium]